MMVADAVEFDVLAIQKESRIGIKLQRPHAEGCFIDIDGFAILPHCGHGDISIGFLVEACSPQPRIGNGRFGFGRDVLGGDDVKIHRRNGCNGAADFAILSVDLEDPRCYAYVRILFQIVVHRYFQADARRCFRNFRRCDIGAPLTYMHGSSLHEPHIPIEACSGIPTGRCGLPVRIFGDRIIESNRQNVFFAKFYVRCQVQAE
jgi:hypothetical protein